MNINELELNVNRNEVICSECRGMMLPMGKGRFVCDCCGHEYVNDFGKVRSYLAKRGQATVQEIALWTGISVTKILFLLKQGRIMLTQDSDIMLHCDCCGRVIRHGNLCDRCQERTHTGQGAGIPETSKGTYNMICYDTGMGMRFINNRRQRRCFVDNTTPR